MEMNSIIANPTHKQSLSQDLRRNIPEVKGLTPGGRYYCKRFYLQYNKVFEMFPQLEETSVPQRKRVRL